jgi:hypothetical protein
MASLGDAASQAMLIKRKQDKANRSKTVTADNPSLEKKVKNSTNSQNANLN